MAFTRSLQAEHDTLSVSPPAETLADALSSNSTAPNVSHETAISSASDIAEPCVSKFVIYTPENLKTLRSNDATALRPEDVRTLENEFAAGGTLVSVHTPGNALAWLEAHYDDPLLESMRSGAIGGPMAVMLSSDEPALTIFGSVLDDFVSNSAKLLSEASGFAVMVRPVVDDPISKFVQATVREPAPGGPSKLRENSRKTVWYEGPGHTSELQGDRGSDRNDLNDAAEEGSVFESRAYRLRGGVGSDEGHEGQTHVEVPKWEGEHHSCKVALELRMDENIVHEADIFSYFKFKTQSRTASDPVLFSAHPRPEVISLVFLDVDLRRGDARLDRSYSNIAFLVHRANSIFRCEFDARGFEPPEAKLKYQKQKSTQKGVAVTAGMVSGNPTLAGTVSGTTGASDTVERADEKMRHENRLRKELDGPREGPREGLQVLRRFMAANRDGAPHEMRVEFGLGMTLDHGKLSNLKLPKISFVLRSQIMIWVTTPESRTKWQGILAHVSTYIPDIQIPRCLCIPTQRIVANLNADWAEDRPTAESADNNKPPYDASMAVAVARPDGSKTQKKPTMLESFLRKLKFAKQLELPLYETVSRGWDDINKKWKNVVWPALDKHFYVSEKSRTAAYEKDLEEPPSQADQVTPEPAKNGTSSADTQKMGAGTPSGSAPVTDRSNTDNSLPATESATTTSSTSLDTNATNIPLVAPGDHDSTADSGPDTSNPISLLAPAP
ncbi:hypothetical protein B0H10DRAFT_2207182 [Mycena sp. CBHHK59/15]|nr:hypothetical protein B0H10DRAFT_2207182 [Mycena sp. CBHHK59/15]